MWTPLILVGLVLVTVFVVYLIGYHNTEYEPDDYQIAAVDYENSDRFEVTDRYELLVRDKGLLSIAEKFNGYVKMILGKELHITDKKPKARLLSLQLMKTTARTIPFLPTTGTSKSLQITKRILSEGYTIFLSSLAVLNVIHRK